MKNNNSEYDLNKIKLKEELKYVDLEINTIRAKMAQLSNDLRWKYSKRQRILSEIGYGN